MPNIITQIRGQWLPQLKKTLAVGGIRSYLFSALLSACYNGISKMEIHYALSFGFVLFFIRN